MTSRRVGKRSIATERRKKDGKRGGSRQVGKAERLSAKERRQMIQLVACGSIFVLFVAVKLLLPEKIAPLNEKLEGALERNMDVQAVFSAVGRAFSGEEDAAQEVYQAVFRPERTEEALKTSALLPENTVALNTLQQYRQIPLPEEQMEVGAEEASQSEISTLAYVLYSKENLPDAPSVSSFGTRTNIPTTTRTSATCSALRMPTTHIHRSLVFATIGAADALRHAKPSAVSWLVLWPSKP